MKLMGMFKQKYSHRIWEKASRIKLLALDVDGVLTDGTLIYSDSGESIKHFSVKDGLGIHLIKKTDVKCVFITARASSMVRKRADELGVDKVYQNFHDKINALESVKKEFSVTDDEICFVGDDLIDLPILKRVGLSITPINASEDVRQYAHLITDNPGGEGAVREVCDLILKAQGKWEEVTSIYFS
jgi:3-deoxy-D-manno-octulosonate 8-phosphate phosphatase (KDO 8-P phosphatase)